MTYRLSAPMPVDELRSLLSYDSDTGIFRWAKPPAPGRHRFVGTIAGKDGTSYRQIKIGGVHYMAHRLAWYHSTGDWPTVDIDHINGDPRDNRLSNLRQATQSQNNGNRRSRHGSSRFKGVTWHRRCRKWQAQIECDGVAHYLGLFTTEEAASLAYQEAAARLFGEFARAS